MSKLAEFREKNPAYKDVPDDKLAPALHKKFYSSIPQDEFFKQVGFTPVEEPGLVQRGLSAIGDLRKRLQQQTNDYEAQQPQQQSLQSSSPQSRATPPNPLDAGSLSGLAAGMGPVNMRTALTQQQGANPMLVSDEELLSNPGAPKALKAEENRREMDAYKGAYLAGYERDAKNLRLEGDDARQFAQQKYDEDFSKGAPTTVRPEASWKDTFNIGATQAGRGMARGFYATLESVGDMVGSAELSQYAGEDRAKQEEAIASSLRTALGKVPKKGFKSIVGDAIPTIISQGAPIAAAALATVATRNPEVGKAIISAGVLAPMGVQSYGNAYADGKQKGLALEDRVTYGVGTALAEVLPERISLGYIMDLLTKQLKAGGKKAAEQSVAKELAKRYFQMQGIELATEEITTVSQFLLDRYYTNPDLTLKDLQEQMIRTALVTPVATTALGAAGAAGTLVGSALNARQSDLASGLQADQRITDAIARQSLDPSNAQMREVAPPDRVQPPQGFDYRQETANVAPPLDAASYQGPGANQEGSAGLASNGGVGAGRTGEAAQAPAQSSGAGVAVGESTGQQTAAVDPLDALILEREAQAVATGDPIEVLVTQAEGAAIRNAARPQPTNGIDIDQDALLADVEAMFTDGGNLMVQGENAREAVKRIDPKALASALPRGDGSLLVPQRFAGPVMDALQGAKQRVSVAFGGDGMVQAPDVAQFRATVPTQEEVQDVPATQEAQETRGQEVAQESRDDLIARYSSAEPFSDEESALSDRLKGVTRKEVGAKINAGEMPVFETGRDTFATITPSAQQPGMFQVTRYNRSGVMGDSQYKSVDDALAGEFFHQKRMIPQAEAEQRFAEALQAESQYQARKSKPDISPDTITPNPAPALAKGADKPKRQPPARKPDPVTVDRAQRNADDLRAMAQDAGWAEEGGKLIRDAEGNASRTKWIPRAEWFMTGMESRPDVLAQHIEAAARGEWIPVKSARTIEGMVEWLDAQRGQATMNEDASMYDFEASFDDVLDVPDAREVAEFFDDAFGDFAEQSEADAMRAMGFTEEEIANAGGQTQAGAGSAETADARGTAEAGGRAGEAGAAQEEASQGQQEVAGDWRKDAAQNARKRIDSAIEQSIASSTPVITENLPRLASDGWRDGVQQRIARWGVVDNQTDDAGRISLIKGSTLAHFYYRNGDTTDRARALAAAEEWAKRDGKPAQERKDDRKAAKEDRAKPMLQSNGKPFPSEKLAAESARQRKLDMVPVKVDGGWGLANGLPSFKNAKEVDAWLTPQIQREPDQLRNEGVGLITLKEGKSVTTYDAGMTGRQRVDRYVGGDQREVYRLDDGRLVWWDYESGRVMDATNDSRVELRVAAPTQEQSAAPDYLEVEYGDQVYNVLLPDTASRVTDEQLEDELSVRDYPEAVNEMFRQRVADARREPLTLDTYTNADIAQREAEQQERADAEAKAERDAAAKQRQDEERAEVRARSEAAAQTFELGMDPMENLTGRGDIFSQPAPQVAQPAAESDEAMQARRYRQKINQWNERERKFGLPKIIDEARAAVSGNVLGRDFGETVENYYQRDATARATRDWLAAKEGDAEAQQRIDAAQQPTQAPTAEQVAPQAQEARGQEGAARGKTTGVQTVSRQVFNVGGKDPHAISFEHKEDGRLIQTVVYPDGEEVAYTLATDRSGDETWVSESGYEKGEFYPRQLSSDEVQAAIDIALVGKAVTPAAQPTQAPTAPEQSRPAPRPRSESAQPNKRTTDADLEKRILIAADSVAKLRKVDVERVLTQGNIDAQQLADYIKRKRADLAAEVDDVMAEAVAQPASGPKFSRSGQPIESVKAAWRDAGIDFTMTEKGDVVTVSKIVVPEDGRESGIGTQAMEQLVAWADANGKHLALTPSADFGGNKKRLTAFYKRFGFKENKGSSRVFSVSEGMIRENPNGKALYSFAGQNARTADTMALATAQHRIEAGEDAETVRQETGWFRGVDGKWRFEINDADAKLTMDKQTAFGAIDEIGGITVADLISHHALFAAYPNLADTPVTLKQGRGASIGAVTINDGAAQFEIAVGRDVSDGDLLSVLLHEIQHGIQNVEGFARGGSERGMIDAYLKDKARLEDLKQKLQRYENKAGDEARYASDELKAAAIAWADTQGEWYQSAPIDEKVSDYILSQDQLYNEWYKEHAELAYGKGRLDPRQRYQHLAGEVEARNTQARQRMTDAERRATSPSATADVADADVIVVFNGTEMQNAPAPANAKTSDLTRSTLRSAIISRFPSLSKPLDAMLKRGDEGKAGGVVVVEDAAKMAEVFAQKTGRSMEEARKSLQASIRAWHGSPHRFDRFSTQNIGTGEGAQAYGYGLYFASSRDVAEYYRKALSGIDARRQKSLGTLDGVEYPALGVTERLALQWLKQWGSAKAAVDAALNNGYTKSEPHVAVLQQIADGKRKAELKTGALYEVSIAPAEDTFLLWDKPLSEQSAKVREALPRGLDPRTTGEMIYRRRVEGYGSAEEASKSLLESGVRGIKYLDGQSRDSNGDSFNYVVFDDADVEIVDVKFSQNGGINGFYDPKSGLTFLVAPNLTAETAPAVLLHEATHAKQRADIDARALALIDSRDKAVKPVRDFLNTVAARMEAAGEAGNASEASAYIVEEAVLAGRKAGFSAVDSKLMNWIDMKFGKRVGDIVRDFVAMVRAWMMRSGVMLNPSIDDLVALAKLNLRDMGRGDVAGQGGFSRASQIASAAFKRWFGDSKVVDENGKPLVMYHGTPTPDALTEFRPGGGVGSRLSGDAYGVASYFTSSPSEASTYARDEGGAVLPVYLRGEILDLNGELTGDQRERLTRLANKTLLPSDKARFEVGRKRRSFESREDAIEFFDSQRKNWLAFGDGMDRARPDAIVEGDKFVVEYTDFDAEVTIETADQAATLLKAIGWDNLPAAGFDGVMMTRSGGAKWVVMHRPDGNVKSATGNNGNFDPSDRRINFSRTFGRGPAPAAQPAPSATQTQVAPPEETRFQAFQRKAQDKLNRFTVIKEWLAEQGVVLSEQADVYRAEERMHSRFANKAQDFREKTVKPLVEKIQKAGFTMDDVAQFLHAQHAEERNIQIASINPQMPDGGSGMTTADANAILAQAPAELKRLANELRQITVSTKQILLDNGIISQDMANAWDATYQNYVPLKGGPDQGGKGAGKGLKANYKGKRALGHQMREEGEWIVENILADHERALMLAEKNRVGQSLLKMAIEVGRDDLLTVGKPEKRGVLKDNTAYEVMFKGRVVGSFRSLEAARAFKATAPAAMKGASPSEFGIRKTNDPTVAYMSSPMLADNEVNVYVKGQAIRVQINDELLARAYGNMGTEALGAILRVGATINGYFSTIYTGYNPEFILTNIQRDFMTGIANVTGEEGAMMALRAAKEYPFQFADLLRYATTGNESQWIKMYREDGGNTGAAYLSDLERLGDEISTEYAAYKGVFANLKEGQMKRAARAAGRKVFDKTLVWVERVNQAGENAMRLAIYKAMVESGKSRAAAASLAKNATVNFNRTGEMGRQVNALWLFYNAGVQGTASIAHANIKGKHKWQARAVSAGMLGLGYLMATAIGADEDEDDYDKLNDYTKARNLVYRNGEGWGMIPVPYGYGFFWNMGRAIADAERKGGWGKAPWHVASSFVEEFTPFGAVVAGDELAIEQAVLGALPTLAQIPASVAMNRTTMAGPMRPESAFDKYQPDNEKMWRGTKGTLADELAQAMAQGGVEVSPETMKYLMRTFTGGAGTFVTSVGDAAWLTANGATMEAKEIPFVRKFYTETDVREARSAYYGATGEAEKVVRQGKSLLKMGDYAAYGAHTVENQEMYMLDAMADAYAKAIRASRDYADTIRTSKDLGIKEKREQLKKVETEEQKLYDLYLEVFKSQTRK